MNGYTLRFRPRYSLRLLLICIGVMAVVVATYREPLRRCLERLVAGSGKPVDHILIVGPQTAGAPTALSPPNPAEIVRALADAGDPDKLSVNTRMIIEPISEYLDPPEYSFAIGYSQLHHSRYKCNLILPTCTRAIYIDHNHRCVP